jgi:hypothetical protein
METGMTDLTSSEEHSLHEHYALGEPSACLHHHWCAYTGTEADRCPRCHALWVVIVRRPENYGGGTRKQHERAHDARQAQRAVEKAREATRKAASV